MFAVKVVVFRFPSVWEEFISTKTMNVEFHAFAICVVWKVIIVAPSGLYINEVQVAPSEGDSVILEKNAA